MAETQKINTPVGDLEWVFIDGEGKEDLQGNQKYSVTVVLDPKQVDDKTTAAQGKAAQAFLDSIDAFWAQFKPKSVSNPKSTGTYPHTVDSGEKDENGDRIYTETGKVQVVLKTGIAYTDGSPKVIKVFNAKGAEVNLMNKKIGNGSRGRVGGVMAIYELRNPKGKIMDAGITFYLNSVQLSKFVEFTGGDNFDELEDEDGDGFEGVGEMGGLPEEPAEDKSTAKASPRLD